MSPSREQRSLAEDGPWAASGLAHILQDSFLVSPPHSQLLQSRLCIWNSSGLLLHSQQGWRAGNLVLKLNLRKHVIAQLKGDAFSQLSLNPQSGGVWPHKTCHNPTVSSLFRGWASPAPVLSHSTRATQRLRFESQLSHLPAGRPQVNHWVSLSLDFHKMGMQTAPFFFLATPCMACGVLVPQPGLKPMPPALGIQES